MTSCDYDNLKQELINEISTSDLPKIAQYFNTHIQSRRTLSKIKSAREVFFFLERRNVLHKNDVTSLVCVGQYLQNNKIVELSKAYEKLFVEPQSCFCGGTDLCFKPPDINFLVKDVDISLQKALNNVAHNIGGKWKILARELDIQECFIDEITHTYVSHYEQTVKALTLWKQKEGAHATLKALRNALECRLCKIHGLGVYMLEPPMTVL